MKQKDGSLNIKKINFSKTNKIKEREGKIFKIWNETSVTHYLGAIIKLICEQPYSHKFDMLWSMYMDQLHENQVPKHN